MEKRLFVNYTAEDRLQMLQDNCTKPLEEYGYNKPLTKDQLKDIKDQLSSAAMTLHDVQELIAEASTKRLEDFTPRELMVELARRGFKGTLEFTQTRVIDIQRL